MLKQESDQKDLSCLNKPYKRRSKKLALTSATDYMNNLHIENKYASLITLIDTIYPPNLCTLCDTVFPSRTASNQHFAEKHKKKSRFICIHPHCNQRFLSRGALRFHVSHAHLIIQSKKPLPDPSFSVDEPISTSTTPSPVLSKSNLGSFSSMSPPPVTLPPHTTSIHPPHTQSPLPSSAPLIPPSSSSSASCKSSKHALIGKETKQRSASPVASKVKYSLKKQPSYVQADSTPSPPPSPFSLYHPKKHSPSRKAIMSTKAERFLNSIYPPLQCPSCKKLFGRKTNVIKHLTEAHIGQEPYRCIYPKCNHPRLYATREGLVYHIVRVHDNSDNQQ